MSLSRSWLGAFLLAGAVACVATGAEARRLGVESNWRAPEACPTAAEFAAKVQQRFGSAGLAVPLKFVTKAEDGRFVMSVEAGEGVSPRRIASHACEDLLEAALLMVGMARDVPQEAAPKSDDSTKPADAGPTRKQPSSRIKKTKKRSNAKPRRQRAQAQPQTATPANKVDNRPATAPETSTYSADQPTTPEDDPAIAAKRTEDEEEEEAMRIEATADAAPRVRRSTRTRPQPWLGATIGVGLGLRAPMPNYLRLHGHVELGFRQLSLRLGTTLMPSARRLRDTWRIASDAEEPSIEIDNIEIAYFGWSIDSALCWRFRGAAVRSGRQRLPISFPVCAGAGVGTLTARSYAGHLVGEQSNSAAFWRLDTSVAADWHFARNFQWSLGIGVELFPGNLEFTIEDRRNQQQLSVCCTEWFAFQVSTAIRFAGPELQRRRRKSTFNKPGARNRRATPPPGGVR